MKTTMETLLFFSALIRMATSTDTTFLLVLEDDHTLSIGELSGYIEL